MTRQDQTIRAEDQRKGRFIQPSLREWTYAQAYRDSRQRKAELPLWLHRCNWHRPHAGSVVQVPSIFGLPEDRLSRLHI